MARVECWPKEWVEKVLKALKLDHLKVIEFDIKVGEDSATEATVRIRVADEMMEELTGTKSE